MHELYSTPWPRATMANNVQCKAFYCDDLRIKNTRVQFVFNDRSWLLVSDTGSFVNNPGKAHSMTSTGLSLATKSQGNVRRGSLRRILSSKPP